MDAIGLSATDSDGNPLTIREARDSYNVSHTITKKLGEGGQGLVCMTENPEIVLKFGRSRKSHQQRQGQEELSKKFEKNQGNPVKTLSRQAASGFSYGTLGRFFWIRHADDEGYGAFQESTIHRLLS